MMRFRLMGCSSGVCVCVCTGHMCAAVVCSPYHGEELGRCESVLNEL